MTKSFADIKNLNPQKVGLGEAAKRDVGTGANQIPDMSAWKFQESADGTKHCWTFPSGWMIQHISVNAPSQTAAVTSSWLVPFPERCITAWHSDVSGTVLDLNSTASGIISAGRTYHIAVTTTTIQTGALGGHEIFGIGR